MNSIPPPPGPDHAMMAPMGRLMSFMESLDETELIGTFANHDVVIIDSFAPYVFAGQGSVQEWARHFAGHVRDHRSLRHAFGEAQEFSQSGEATFFSQPITWTFETDRGVVVETGGLAVILVHDDGGWRIRNLAWAVTETTSVEDLPGDAMP